MKKYIVIVLLAVSFTISPVFVSAQSTPMLAATQARIQELRQQLISQLLALINQLKQQLSVLQSQQNQSTPHSTFVFSNLSSPPGFALNAPTGGSYTPDQSVHVLWGTINAPSNYTVSLKLKDSNGVSYSPISNLTGFAFDFSLRNLNLISGVYHFEAELKNGAITVATANGSNFMISSTVYQSIIAANFPDRLSSCTKYKTTFVHPLTGGIMSREILGIIGGKCDYIEQMPNNGKMECKFTESARIAVAQYYRDAATAELGGTSLNTDNNPLEEALNNGMCVISGY